jgi:hypothetical protein
VDYALLRDRFRRSLRGVLKGSAEEQETFIDELIEIVEELYKQAYLDKRRNERGMD